MNYFLLCLLLIVSVSKAQNSSENIIPKADIHIGISLLKGSYIGSTWQVSDKFYLGASYGAGTLFPFYTDNPKRIISLEADYDLTYFLLNITYTRYEEVNSYFSHIVSININLFSLDSPGFHLIGGIGGFSELAKYYSSEPLKLGVTFNLAAGFRIL
jgi:hypothetical protein